MPEPEPKITPYSILNDHFERQKASQAAATRAREIQNERNALRLERERFEVAQLRETAKSPPPAVPKPPSPAPAAATSERERVRKELLDELGEAERHPMKTIMDATCRVLGPRGYADSEGSIRGALKSAGLTGDAQNTFDKCDVAIVLAANLVGRPNKSKRTNAPKPARGLSSPQEPA